MDDVDDRDETLADALEGARVAGEAAKRGAETVASGAEKLRTEAEKFTDEEQVGEAARRAATGTVKGVKKAGETFRDVAGDAGKKAGEVFDEAKNYYDRASHIAGTGAKFTRASAAAITGRR